MARLLSAVLLLFVTISVGVVKLQSIVPRETPEPPLECPCGVGCPADCPCGCRAN